MKTQQNNNRNNDKRALPFVIEFVKFSSGFAAIVAVALFALRLVSVEMQ